MGASQSSTGAGVFVELEQYDVFPGAILRGRVHVSVDNAVVQINSVNLKLRQEKIQKSVPVPEGKLRITLSGYEKTNWRTVTVTRRRVEQGARGGPGLNNQNAVAFDIRDGQKPGFQQQSDPNKNLQEVEYENVEDVKNHEGRHDFFKFTLPVSQGSVLTRGQYTYPFQVQLPDFLPGSCALGRDPKKDLALRHNEKYFFANCKYKIKAFLDVKVGEKSLFSSGVKTVKCSQEFFIVNRCPPAKAVAKTALTEIRACGCCWSKGTSSIAVQMSQDCFKAGDQIGVLATFDNSKASSDLNQLDLTLYRVVELRSNNTGSRFGGGAGQQQTYRERSLICQDTKPGCAAGAQKQQTFYMTLPRSEKEVVPTCEGGLVKVFYELEVRGDVTCANDPVADVPVFIYATPPVYMKPVVQNWAPQVFQVTVVNDLNASMGYVSGNMGYGGNVNVTVPAQQTMNYGAAGQGYNGYPQQQQQYNAGGAMMQPGGPPMAGGTMMQPQYQQQPQAQYQQQQAYNYCGGEQQPLLSTQVMGA